MIWLLKPDQPRPTEFAPAMDESTGVLPGLPAVAGKPVHVCRAAIWMGRRDCRARAYCLTGGCSRTTDSLPHHLCSHCLSARRLGILPFPLSHACLPWRDLWSCGRRASVVQAERQIHRALLARCVTA